MPQQAIDPSGLEAHPLGPVLSCHIINGAPGKVRDIDPTNTFEIEQ
jgi:hypothetical protein